MVSEWTKTESNVTLGGENSYSGIRGRRTDVEGTDVSGRSETGATRRDAFLPTAGGERGNARG